MSKLTWRDYLSYYWHIFYRRHTPKGRKRQKQIDDYLDLVLGGE